jgi:hypothetical protein
MYRGTRPIHNDAEGHTDDRENRGHFAKLVIAMLLLGTNVRDPSENLMLGAW